MRSLILAAAVVFGAAALPGPLNDVAFVGSTLSAAPMQQEPSTTPAPSSSEPAQPVASQPAPQPPPSQPAPEVRVDVKTTSWHPSPTWVAIGAIGAVLLVVILVMATRSGSNTVIRG